MTQIINVLLNLVGLVAVVYNVIDRLEFPVTFIKNFELFVTKDMQISLKVIILKSMSKFSPRKLYKSNDLNRLPKLFARLFKKIQNIKYA